MTTVYIVLLLVLTIVAEICGLPVEVVASDECLKNVSSRRFHDSDNIYNKLNLDLTVNLDREVSPAVGDGHVGQTDSTLDQVWQSYAGSDNVLCNWKFKANFDSNRIPPTILEAELMNSQADDVLVNSWEFEESVCTCKPVNTENFVLKFRECFNRSEQWEMEKVIVPVGYTCMNKEQDSIVIH